MNSPILTRAELESFDPQNPANGQSGQGRSARYLCPLCGDGKPRDGAHRCLSVDFGSGAWNCFRCGQGGKLRDNWDEKPLQKRQRAQRNLSRAFGLDVPKPSQTLENLPQLAQNAQNGAFDWRSHLRNLQSLENTPGATYLENRGLSLDVCLAARVKWAPNWLGRPGVVFPIYNRSGDLVAAQGRYTDGRDNPKTRTVGPKKEGVFLTGDFWALVEKGAPVVLTEAPIDALSIAMGGFPALALCGKDGLPAWLPIRCAFKDVILAFDSDEAGDGAATKLGPVLGSLGAKVRRVVPIGKDWNADLQEQGRAALEDWLMMRLLLG